MRDLTTKPTLRFDSNYTGVATQKLAERKNIKFGQDANLSIPDGQERPIASYYELRQLVKDKYEKEIPQESNDETAAWVQDGPYEPEYDDDVITVGHSSINFRDDPGFSTTQPIGANEWLNSYDVYFRWRVTAKYEGGASWQSPPVHHHVDAQYNNGQDVAVNSQPAGNHVWTVQLPDRPAGP